MSDLFEVVWTIFRPSNLLIGCLILSGALFWIDRLKWARALLVISSAAVAAIAILPVSALLYAPLEARFEMPDLPANIDGIVVLGGAVNPLITAEWGQPSLSSGAERMTEAVGLAKRYPAAKLLFTGGPWRKRGLSEADVAQLFFAQQGIEDSRLILESKASSTYENAVFTRELVEPVADETWILVTSAYHMPRSVGTFRKQGWRILPYPVDFKTTEMAWMMWPPDVGRALAAFDFILREWVSIIWYRLAGRSDSLLPS